MKGAQSEVAGACRDGNVVSETLTFSSDKISFPAQLPARKEIPFCLHAGGASESGHDCPDLLLCPRATG